MPSALLARVSASAILAVLLGTTASAQHGTNDPAAVINPDLAEENMDVRADGPLAEAIEDQLIEGLLDEEIDGEFDAGVLFAARAAYAQRVFQPIWSKRGAHSLLNAHGNLFKHGLIAENVSENDVLQLANRRFGADSPERQAKADILLTVAWLRMASAVSGGLGDEGEAVASRPAAPARSELTQAILEAGDGAAAELLTEFEPVHPQYKALKTQLLHYREIKTEGGWLAIPDGEVIELGDSDPRVPALRQRLLVEGYEASPPVEEIVERVEEVIETGAEERIETAETILNEQAVLFDESLEIALKTFQAAHGLEDDGVVGPATLAALNESPASKIDRIADTMHRWRKHGDLGSRHIWANIPSYLAEAWNDGTREIRMRTIVGLPTRETPVFSDEIEYVVANPKWYAPVSIVRNDKLPKLAEDASYAENNNFTVYDRATNEVVSPYLVDWTDPASAAKYRLVQGAGEGNALGEMKIIFPNQYAVYLHGTPGRALFERSQRAFSSGCVRLEDPVAMARWLARADEAVDAPEVQDAVESGDNTRLDFEETTPVHITYMTVTVSDDGTPNFWRDIYDRDDGIEHVTKHAPRYTPIDLPDFTWTSEASQDVDGAG